MKFLIDQNLPPALATHLASLGHDAAHVKAIGLEQTSDAAVAAFARGEDRIIVTKDSDFDHLALTPSGPRVLRLCIGNASVAALLAWLGPRLDNALAQFQGANGIVELH